MRMVFSKNRSLSLLPLAVWFATGASSAALILNVFHEDQPAPAAVTDLAAASHEGNEASPPQTLLADYVPQAARDSVRPILINGVQPYALDQPRVPALLQPLEGGGPLSVYSEEVERKVFAFDAFLDTGASRMVLSKADRTALQVKAAGPTVEDVGIGGKEAFDVSIPYRLWVGDSSTDTLSARQFLFQLNCVLQLRKQDQNLLGALPPSLNQTITQEMKGLEMEADDMNELFMASINIVGTPFIRNCTVIMDPRPVVAALQALMPGSGGGNREEEGGGGNADPLDQLLEQAEKGGNGGLNFGRILVRLLPSNQSYPATRIVVPLVLKNMDPNPVPVTKADVPFIPGIEFALGNRSARGDLLLDTGGGVSLISTRIAQALGLDLSRPQLSVRLQGVGQGSGELKGFWIDRLALPTSKGPSVIYVHVPVFVADIEGIDGIVGMNLLGPSIFMNLNNLESNPQAILNDLRPGVLPFSRIVIDLPRRQLGLDPA